MLRVWHSTCSTIHTSIFQVFGHHRFIYNNIKDRLSPDGGLLGRHHRFIYNNIKSIAGGLHVLAGHYYHLVLRTYQHFDLRNVGHISFDSLKVSWHHRLIYRNILHLAQRTYQLLNFIVDNNTMLTALAVQSFCKWLLAPAHASHTCCPLRRRSSCSPIGRTLIHRF